MDCHRQFRKPMRRIHILNMVFDLNLGYDFSDAFSLHIFGNLTDINSNYDGGSFFDAPHVFKSKQYRAGLTSKYIYTNGSINLNAAYSDYDREFISNFPSTFESKNYVVDAYNKYNFNNTFYTILGLNVINNKAKFTEQENFTIIDPYINTVYVSEFGLNINAGVRINNHSEYGSHFTYSINPSYAFKFDADYIKLFGSYSTSFLAPSLSQLFGFFGSNQDLEPEENRTIEGGIEYNKGNNFRTSVLFFNREEKNFFIYDFTLGYLNATDKLHTRGIELELRTQVHDKLSLTANYTFIEHEEAVAVQIPKHKANLELGYDFSNRTFASLSYQYTHDRLTNDFSTFPATPVNLESFSLVNLYASHSTDGGKIKFFAGIDNLLNEDYSELYGFTSLGRNVRIGFRLDLL